MSDTNYKATKFSAAEVKYLAYLEESRRRMLDQIIEWHEKDELSQIAFDKWNEAENRIYFKLFPVPGHIKSST